ncbi:MAG: FtsW/RodA/SpoVE family cell cycle protein, partial [Roseburia sp.]
MTNLIVEISKYLMIFFFALYTYECFAVFKKKNSEEKQKRIFKRQVMWMYFIHLAAFLAIYAVTDEEKMIVFYFLQALLILAIQLCYRIFYKKASSLVLNNLCMLLVVGFLVLTRLSYERAIRQYVIVAGAAAATLILPFLIKKI